MRLYIACSYIFVNLDIMYTQGTSVYFLDWVKRKGKKTSYVASQKKENKVKTNLQRIPQVFCALPSFLSFYFSLQQRNPLFSHSPLLPANNSSSV